jgi:hypothetical protein
MRRLGSARTAGESYSRADPRASPQVQERELSWLGGIVEVVTACAVGGRWERAIMRCDDDSCASVVAVRRTGDACEWYCPSCATFGAVVGWRGSRFDLSEVQKLDDSDRSDAAIFTRLDELECVRNCNLSQRLKLTLALATPQADHVVVTCAERELSELLCALEEVMGKIPAAERRLVDRFVARVDAALLACEAYAEAPPTLH